MRRRTHFWIGLLAVTAIVLFLTEYRSSSGPGRAAPISQEGVSQEGIEFSDARAQAIEFIGYDTSIALTPEQERIKTAALSSLPAPCCSDYTAATCCCPCNLAKTIWGLANLLIAERDYDVTQVKQAAADWIQFTNPGGYTGDACFTAGGCERSFENNGCGGMGAELVYGN